ncbi:MAG: PAS domain-containing protein [Verrucomicrobiae bacterium]|nr:PAS domain-containing protein [Verrucomicrobiae bacterium]
MKPAFLDKILDRMDRLDPQSVAPILIRLVREKGFLETVFDALKEGIVVLGQGHRALWLNRAARELLGLDARFVPGASIEASLPEEFWRAVEAGADPGEPRHSLHRNVEIAWPRRRILQIAVTRLASADPGAGDLLLIARDVTEEHRRAAMTVEQERLGAITTLAAGVAHEIGNPLNTLNIHLQLIERETCRQGACDREKVARHVRVCADEVHRLDHILHRFLRAVRPTQPALEPCLANELLKETLDVLQPEIEKRGVLVEREFGRDLPRLLADRGQIQQVFFNLVRNGLQAMTSGGILRVRTELVGERLAITVRDTGGGIPPETLQRLFEPYFTTKSEGTGLGLLIVQRVVREHGGLIEVSSEPGRGTTFRVLLPIAEKRTRLLTSEETRDARAAAGEKPAPRRSRRAGRHADAKLGT